MLCHIVTGLRHLLLRPASMRISQASVAEMLQKLSAARTLALPMLARAAICATGKEHLPDVWASFRMTASTAIASVFRHSATSGGAISVAARNLRPHTLEWWAAACPPLSRSLMWFEAAHSLSVSAFSPLNAQHAAERSPNWGHSSRVLIPNSDARSNSISNAGLTPAGWTAPQDRGARRAGDHHRRHRPT
jgi:hypothetical protein